MFENTYTRTAIEKTIRDIKVGRFITDVATHILYIGYLIYAVSVQIGAPWINVTLLSLSSVYFVFLLVIKRPDSDNTNRMTVKICDDIYKCSKYLLKVFVISIALIEMIEKPTTVTPISIMLTTFLIAGFVLQIAAEVVFNVAISRFNFLKEAVIYDFENITKPVRAIQKLAKRITGQDIAADNEPTRTRRVLDEILAEKKAERKSLREEKSPVKKIRRLFTKSNNEEAAKEEILTK